MKYFYDMNNLNIIFSENEIFNIPYFYEFINDKIKNKIFSKLNLSFLNLQIENEIDYKDDIKGNLNLIYNQIRGKAIYELNKDYFLLIILIIQNPKFVYEGEINFNPFYSVFKGDTDKVNLSYLFKSNSFFTQLFKTEILNNKNLNIDLIINSKKFSIK